MEAKTINYDSLVRTIKLMRSGNHLLNDSIFYFLMRACELGELDLCEACIDAGVDINIVVSTQNQSLLMPLINSVSLNLKVAQWLISKGIDINKYDVSLGHTPLSLACYKGNFELVKLFIQNAAKLDNCNKNPIWWTVSTDIHNNMTAIYNIVEFLLNICNNTDCDNPDENSNPFIKALVRRQSQIVELFLNHGVSPNQYSNHGRTPLYISVQNRDIQTARILLEHHADANAPLTYNCMDMAIKNGDTKMQELLASYGAKTSK